MEIIFQNEQKGILKEFTASGIRVPFGDDLGPSFYYKSDRKQIPVTLNKQGDAFVGEAVGIEYSLSYTDCGDCLKIRATLKNNNDTDFTPEAVGLKLGVDTYMIEYPQWNDVFFPTFLRCEKTHFIGYFMSPLQSIVSVSCDQPISAWELDYNTLGADEDTSDFGHRIYTANLLLLCRGPLPERHPQDLNCLKAGQSLTREIYLMPQQGTGAFRSTLSDKFGIPAIDMERYTLAKGESAKIKVNAPAAYTLTTLTPSGKTVEGDSVKCEEYGVYTVTLKCENGKECEAKFYCRHDYAWYLKNARKNAVEKPQKAATHTESWYGHFSAALAKKHFPDPALDEAALANFNEIMPLMYKLDEGEAIIIPFRIQNTACLVGLLTDMYEADPAGGRQYLEWANNMAADLIRRQSPDGAYRKRKEHYTAVIYIAKSMLELALCEKELGKTDPVFAERYAIHYASAKAAVDDLCALRETIGTEGEHTLEDGMVSCAALQLGFFALTLPEEERAPYIEAAEHMISIHRCLEQMETPDCRMRGATLRFWEAQYDVMIRGNMLNSPHGWTSWKNYATYYLYLLTGKEEYLRQTMDTIGTCMQTMSEEGDLRWAFIVDPYLNVKRMECDYDTPSPDGYESAKYLTTKAYRSKYERRVFGEEYVPMVSGWYRACPEGRMMGGYPTCPLIWEDGAEWVDNQGGCCDNDVHEHYKCMEETVFGKAFVLIREDSSILSYNCTATLEGDTLTVTPYEDCDKVHINTPRALTLIYDGKETKVAEGMSMVEVK